MNATLTLSEIATLADATLQGDGSRAIAGPASLSDAGPQHVSFLGDPRHAAELSRTRAAGVFVRAGVVAPRADLALLVCANPSRAFSRVVQAFRPELERIVPGVHPAAVVAASARIDASASVGACAVVAEHAVIGADCVLHPGVVVGAHARVGRSSVLQSNVVLYPGVTIGARCLVHAGSVIGSDGFGFEPTAAGWEKIPQCGTVVVEDDVEIGANCAIDRARFGTTRIGAGAKLDNLVHVAHNVDVGDGALLIAQVGVAGSTKIGARAILAGQVGVIGHVTIGPAARIAAQSGVSRDLEGGQDYFGSPARPQAEMLRSLALQRKLPDMLRRIQELEARLAALEQRT
jgi:UDP-3-O-[3-hydroxymyristoyl] glucosamine N-acyltransferase